MYRRFAILLTAALLVTQSGNAQAGKKLAFDVVSIKPNDSGDNRRMIGGGPGGRFTATNIPLRQLIVLAYGDRSGGGPAQDIEITGLPGWATSDGYDVQAQPEAGVTPTQQQTQEMLQSMLADRFQLKIHRETKDAPIYHLVVGKDGVKMKLAEDQTPLTPPAPPPPGGAPPPPGAAVRVGPGGPGGAPPPPGTGPSMTGPVPRGMIMMGLGQVRAGSQPVSALASLLSGQAGRKVVDKTGLTGLYDIDLKWTPDQLPSGQPLPPGFEIDPTGPTLVTAIQEQLGLRLVPETGPVDTLVVESVQRPSEN